MSLQNWEVIAIASVAYVLAIYSQNRGLAKRFAHLDKRIDDMGKRFDNLRDILRAEMRAMKAEILIEIESQANRKVV